MKYLPGALVIALTVLACNKGEYDPDQPQITSLLGKPYFADAVSDSNVVAIDEELADDPDDLELLFRKGRALAGIKRMNEAIEVYKSAISVDPGNPVFHRRLGHRYISIRNFDDAVKELTIAADLNEDYWPAEKLEEQSFGTFNWRHEFDIRYHLGLAYYLKHDFANAETHYKLCLDAARDDNAKVAALNWLYLSLRRQNRIDEANALLNMVSTDMEISSNATYHNLLLYYKGALSETDLLNPDNYVRFETVGYGLATFYLAEGDSAKAFELYERIITSDHWIGFGLIAAEVELARK